MKKKLKLRFIRNISICVIALLIVARILDIMPGFKRDKTAGITNLVVGDEDVTEELNSNIYIDENSVIYLSFDDVKEIFDENLTYNEETKQLITTSRTKVAIMNLNENKIIVNDAKLDCLGKIIERDGKIYLPITDLTLVYNIELNYNRDSDIVKVDRLNNQLTKATIAKNAKIKMKMRAFSKTLGEVTQGEQVSYYGTQYNGWVKVRTNSGIVGYIKESNLTNFYEIRQDMEESYKAENISEEETEGWININNDTFKEEMLKDYDSRSAVIKTVLGLVLSQNTKGVKVNLELDEEFNFEFIRELTPRLREYGISTAVFANTNKDTKKVQNIVDYIIK